MAAGLECEATAADADADADANVGGTSSSTTGGKKRMNIVRWVSVHAERFVRGLDSAIDFVDGRVGFGTV